MRLQIELLMSSYMLGRKAKRCTNADLVQIPTQARTLSSAFLQAASPLRSHMHKHTVTCKMCMKYKHICSFLRITYIGEVYMGIFKAQGTLSLKQQAVNRLQLNSVGGFKRGQDKNSFQSIQDGFWPWNKHP